MQKVIYSILGYKRFSVWVYEKNTYDEGWTVQTLVNGNEIELSYNSNYEVEKTILDIIQSEDFDIMYQKNDTVVIVLLNI